MIKKIYRLRESEVKKVLKYGKPFFSYGIVSQSIPNQLPYHRFGIIIGSKSSNNSINRNMFRRLFFQESGKYIDMQIPKKGQDIVFVVKKQFKLDKKDFECIKSFEKDITFLFKKLINQ